MLYVPELSLIPEGDGEFSLVAMTLVPSSSFSADAVIPDAPQSVPAPIGTMSFQFPIQFDASIPAASDGVKLYHQVRNLKLQPGAVIAGYVTLGDAIVGKSSIVLPSKPTADAVNAPALSSSPDRITRLSAQECLGITVATTPAKKASSSAQQLHELGIVDDNQTRKHQNKIATALAARGSSIDPAVVNSGPNVTVAACAQSVFMKQGR